MKFFYFHLMPYAHLPMDYDRDHEAAWVTLPNTYYDPVLGAELYHRYLDELELGDELGFDGICVNEHHQTAYGMTPAPDVLAGALSRRTSKAKIAVLGRALPIIDNPLNIAEEFAMLDNLTRGRFIAGFVRGIGAEYHATGTNPALSLARFREAHDLIIEAWTKPGPFHFEGEHYHYQYVNLWPRPYQKPHPPVWIPSQGSTETIQWAAHPDRRYTYLITFSPIESVRRNLTAYRTQCEAYGYDCAEGQLGWAMPLYVAETDEIARREAGPHIETLYNKFIRSPIEYKLPPGYSTFGSFRKVIEQKYKVREQYLTADILIEQGMFICGSPSSIIERMERLHAELGFGNMISMLQFGTLPADLTEKSVRMFAAEVMPRLRGLGEQPAATAETLPAAE